MLEVLVCFSLKFSISSLQVACIQSSFSFFSIGVLHFHILPSFHTRSSCSFFSGVFCFYTLGSLHLKFFFNPLKWSSTFLHSTKPSHLNLSSAFRSSSRFHSFSSLLNFSLIFFTFKAFMHFSHSSEFSFFFFPSSQTEFSLNYLFLSWTSWKLFAKF